MKTVASRLLERRRRTHGHEMRLLSILYPRRIKHVQKNFRWICEKKKLAFRNSGHIIIDLIMREILVAVQLPLTSTSSSFILIKFSSWMGQEGESPEEKNFISIKSQWTITKTKLFIHVPSLVFTISSICTLRCPHYHASIHISQYLANRISFNY